MLGHRCKSTFCNKSKMEIYLTSVGYFFPPKVFNIFWLFCYFGDHWTLMIFGMKLTSSSVIISMSSWIVFTVSVRRNPEFSFLLPSINFLCFGWETLTSSNMNCSLILCTCSIVEMVPRPSVLCEPQQAFSKILIWVFWRISFTCWEICSLTLFFARFLMRRLIPLLIGGVI